MTRYFDKFLTGYWHENSVEMYHDIGDAIADFVTTEGPAARENIISELRNLIARSCFPQKANNAGHRQFSVTFGNKYHRLIVADEADLMLERLETI